MMNAATAARPQLVRNRLKTTLEAAAPRAAAFQVAVTRELGPAKVEDIEALRAAVLAGGPWLPRLALLADPAVYGRDVVLSEDGLTVIVHEDLAHDEARIAKLYRQALRGALLPPKAQGWTSRVMGWWRAA